MSNRYFGGIIRKTPLALDPALGNAANGVFTMNQYMQAVKDGTWPGFDPYFNQTVLSLHGNGTNGDQNNTFLDSSTNNFTITRNGNTTQGTFSPFSLAAGEWSNFFDGTADWLTAPSNAAFGFGTGAFTIEGFFYISSFSTLQLLWMPGTNNFTCYAAQTTGYITVYNGSTDNASTTAPNLNAWNHVAFVREGTGTNQTKIYLNGVQILAFTNSTNFSTTDFYIGRNGAAGPNVLTGYLSNVRVVKGTAVYTSNFTPPTTPLTAITNTSLLTCQSNRFVDNSTNAFAITANGDVRVTPFSPFAPTAAYSAGTNGGSGYFDGSGDYLQSASSTEYNFGTGDFTIELWVYFIAGGTAASYTLLPLLSGNGSFSPGSDVNWNLWYDITGGTKLVFQRRLSNADTTITSNSYTLPTNAWTHLSVVRNSGTVTFYANGVSIGGGSFTADLSTTQALNIGLRGGGGTPFSVVWYGTMYLSGIKIVKGTASAPSGVPTAPPTGGNLLLNFTNAGIIDNTGKNNLETVGNAQIDTTTKKYGTGSLEFDGTGDWLLMPNTPDQQLGTGNFTIEFWVYLASGDTGSARGLVAKGGASTGWLVSLDSSQKVVFTYTTSTITSSGAITTNAWNHIAVVRSGTGSNQTKIYIGGTNDGTGTVSTDFNQTESMYVGANRTGGDPMKGFIDDLRITKGVARYTANFTPQTSQWQDQ